MDSVDVSASLARVFKDEGAVVRGALMRAIGELGVVEDALSAAIEQALITWPASGVPAVPAAWLTTVAKKKAIDVLRRRRRFTDKVEIIARLEAESDAVDDAAARTAVERRDDRLRLLFISCHPIVPDDEAVALTLQTVGGLTTTEIARAFLVPTTTMEKRLARAKSKLREARVPFEVPNDDEVAERTGTVLAVVYLIFNEGYLASRGDAVIRADLCDEAVRIARLLRSLVDDPEVDGLLALMLFTHARRAARVDVDGELVLLDDQDRTLWDRTRIAEAQRLVDGVLPRRRPGPYQIQAAIAALHAEATSSASTDWAQIAALYAGLARFSAAGSAPSPVVRLNHAVAVAMAHGVDAGLSLVDVLGREGDLDGYHLYWSTRGELQRRRGDVAAARRSFQRARTLAGSAAERAFLTRRLASLD